MSSILYEISGLFCARICQLSLIIHIIMTDRLRLISKHQRRQHQTWPYNNQHDECFDAKLCCCYLYCRSPTTSPIPIIRRDGTTSPFLPWQLFLLLSSVIIFVIATIESHSRAINIRFAFCRSNRKKCPSNQSDKNDFTVLSWLHRTDVSLVFDVVIDVVVRCLGGLIVVVVFNYHKAMNDAGIHS